MYQFAEQNPSRAEHQPRVGSLFGFQAHLVPNLRGKIDTSAKGNPNVQKTDLKSGADTPTFSRGAHCSMQFEELQGSCRASISR
jgi:hypothetical protein